MPPAIVNRINRRDEVLNQEPAALGPIMASRTVTEYDQAVADLNTPVDEIADDPANPRCQQGDVRHCHRSS